MPAPIKTNGIAGMYRMVRHRFLQVKILPPAGLLLYGLSGSGSLSSGRFLKTRRFCISFFQKRERASFAIGVNILVSDSGFRFVLNDPRDHGCLSGPTGVCTKGTPEKAYRLRRGEAPSIKSLHV